MRLKRVFRLASASWILLFLFCMIQPTPVSAANPTIVLNGDFEAGNTGFISEYVYSSDTHSEGVYAINTDPHNTHEDFVSIGDHTSGSGNMMVVNGATNTSLYVWQGTLTQDLVIGRQYDFSVWVLNCVSSNVAVLSFVVDSTVIATYSPDGLEWQRLVGTFTATTTRPVLTIRNSQSAANGNDFAMDDINIYEVGTHTPPSGGTTLSNLALQTDKTSAAIGELVTFTATATGGDGGTPTGTVDFYNGETFLGSDDLNASGIATLSTSSLSQGSNIIQAEYLGDGTYFVQSNAVSVQVGSCLTPTITEVNPNSSSLAGGIPVTITGTNFQQSGCPVSQVTFGKSNAAYTVNSNTQITATAPSADSAGVSSGGWVNISVTQTGGTGYLTNGFVYYGSAPIVTNFTAPAASTSRDIPITAFTGSGSLTITGYMITTSSTQPSAGSAGWEAAAPTTFTVGSDGVFTLYPWVKDELGNVSPFYSSPQSVFVDTVAPVLTAFERYDPAGNQTNQTTLVFHVTFSEGVTDVDAADFEVSGGSTATISGLSQVSATVYAVTVSGGDLATYNGTVGLNLASGQDIYDVIGNPLADGEPTTDEVYLVDTTAPSLTAFERYDPAASLTDANTLIFDVTFSEAVKSVDTTDFEVSGGSTATVTNVSQVSSAEYRATVSGGDLSTFSGTVGLNLAAGQDIMDIVNNALPAGEPATDKTYEIDREAPELVSIERYDPASSSTSQTTLVFHVTFNEEVSAVDAGDFEVSGGSTATVTDLTPVSATVFAATISGGDLAAYTGTVGLDLASGQNITDVIGNALPGDEPATDETYLVDSNLPELLAFERFDPASSPTNQDTLIFHITFSEAVDEIDASDFTVTGGTTAGIADLTSVSTTVYAATVSGGDLSTYTGTVGLDLAIGQNITDLIGNALPAGEPSTDETYEVDHDAPGVLYELNTTPENNSIVTTGLTEITIEFNKAVVSDGGDDAANNIDNYLLVEAGKNNTFDTVDCAGGTITDDVEIVINQATYDEDDHIATISINDGKVLPAGDYTLFICGSTSIYDLTGNPLNGGSDSLLRFTVSFAATNVPNVIPSTGFPMGLTSALPAQSVAYSQQSLELEIPRLNVSMEIIGIPQSETEWNVAWLGDRAGWLEGSAFPTFAGNSVLTGHVWDAFDQPGPFNGLINLQYGDQIVVHAWGEEYIYEIREILTVRSDDVAELLKHQENPWLTLVTCKGFNVLKGTYQWRLLVRAVLVDVQ